MWEILKFAKPLKRLDNHHLGTTWDFPKNEICVKKF